MRAFQAVFSISLVAAGVNSPAIAFEAAPAQPAPAFVDACMALNTLSLEQVGDVPGRVVDAFVVSGKKTPEDIRIRYKKRGHSQGAPTPMLETYPDHCRVEGYMTPHVKFIMQLPPPDKWNGRFLLAACEGWCGSIYEETMMPGLNRGYAVITNDGGHYGDPPFDGVWAYNNVDVRIDFAYRANHVSAQAGKALIKGFYGRPQTYSYIAGFSKGGNAGLLSATRYPEDFDGVFAKAPVPYYQWKNAAHFPWLARAVYPDGDTAVMDSEKLPLIHKAVVAACDTIDGLKDGIIDDPRKCKWDPVAISCKRGQDEATCLTMPQVEALRKVYAPARDAKGKINFPWGTDRGSEIDWPAALYPDSPEPAYVLDGARTGLKYMVFRDAKGPDFDWRTFDYESELAGVEEMGKILDADSTDYNAFKARGGKMIIVHGWADALVSPAMTADWFEKMRAAMGGRDATNDFAQLYVVPGMVHGSGGNAPYEYDALTALENWVEKGIRPTELVMHDEADVTPRRSRPMYPYPTLSRYKGKGDINAASSYEPRQP